jgi:tight adherence protein B
MIAAIAVFVIVVALIMGSYYGLMQLPGWLAARKLDRRLREVTLGIDPVAGQKKSIITEQKVGPLPALDKALGGANSSLAQLIEQSGVATTPSAVMLSCVLAGLVMAVALFMVVRRPIFAPFAFIAGATLPIIWLKHKRSARLKKFEEQFPDALDLMSRALRAGHAFQTSMGMVAEELPAPVGIEFKKAFEQQNFGLPLRDVLDQLAERVTLLDVKFFVTAVTIQRETGGNLAEILDNLAHVVRERFKILRQVRVHTAHGRFTGYVLLSLPAALAVALTFINPEHMKLLYTERMGQTMIIVAIIMQTIGYVWIRKIIKIEV